MRKIIVATLFFLGAAWAAGDSVPANWKLVKDSKALCQIAVPENWIASAGSAYYQEPTIAIAVVTSQSGQVFGPISESLLISILKVPKENVFENSEKRVYYVDRGSAESHSLNVMVAGRTGTCSAHIVYPSSVADETAKKIALSLTAAQESSGSTH